MKIMKMVMELAVPDEPDEKRRDVSAQPAKIVLGRFTGLIPCIFFPVSGAAHVDAAGRSCYIKRVPRVQLSLPVVSCNVV
jgi:hypothetical protein